MKTEIQKEDLERLAFDTRMLADESHKLSFALEQLRERVESLSATSSRLGTAANTLYRRACDAILDRIIEDEPLKSEDEP